MMDSLFGVIMLLRRTGSVEEYTDKFLALACCDADLTEQQLVQMYMTGLLQYRFAARSSSTTPSCSPAPTNRGCSWRPLIDPICCKLQYTKSAPATSAPASSIVAYSGSGKSMPLTATLPRHRLPGGDGPVARRCAVLQL